VVLTYVAKLPAPPLAKFVEYVWASQGAPAHTKERVVPTGTLELAVSLLLADMTVAILSTKIPILIAHGYWWFAAPSGKPGLWSMLHEARTDLSMWLACLFLFVVGGGGRSVDAHLVDRVRRRL
jgi:hypothetical protein